jgi:phosphate transport system permease protein
MKIDGIARTVCLFCLLVGVLFLLLMVAYVVKESSIGSFFGAGFLNFLLKDPWLPLATPPSFGIVHALISTILVAGLSLAVAIPLGIGIGLFIAEVAPVLVRQMLQPALEILAGIPAVVYGFFGYVTLVKNFEQWFDMPTGECILAAGLILGLMVLPFIASTAAESFRSVARELRDTAYSLGVTRFYVVRRIIIKKALPGLFAAVALGLARALGETLAVLMLAGNSVAVPHSLLDRGQPITALLATELGETALQSDEYHALYTSGLFLMALVLLINMVIWYLKSRILGRAHA